MQVFYGQLLNFAFFLKKRDEDLHISLIFCTFVANFACVQ